MAQNQIASINFLSLLGSKARDYAQLFKLRLSSMVVFSALIGYFLGASSIHFIDILLLGFGGLMITGASNAINQILERDIDRLMTRTQNRPLAAQRMQVVEATFAAGLMGVFGLLLLGLYFNAFTGLLAAIALLSYAFLYTPLKRITPIAVLVGAIPGALPPLIGYVAATGMLSNFIIIVFTIQFLWQFPHFWAIAWVAFDDYKKAGIMLLPSGDGRSKYNAFLNIIYILIILPIAVLPFLFDNIGLTSMLIILLSTILFMIPAIRLFRNLELKDAKQLMFASFLYLPTVLLTLIIDKFL